MAGLDPHLHGLAELGLSRYEAKAYLTLIQRQSYIASELAIEAGIPRQRIYDVLNRLVARGLVQERPAAITRYAATDPQTAIQRLLAVQRQSLASLEDASSDLVGGLQVTWEGGRTQNAPLDLVEILHDQDRLDDRLLDLQREAEFELLLFAKGPFAVAANPIGLDATHRIVEAGGQVRCIYEASMLSQPAIVAEAVRLMRVGEVARIVDQLPMKLCLADGYRALFSLADPIAGGVTSTNIMVEHPSLTSALRTAFTAMWRDAEPFSRALERSRSSTA